jgi:hypothetical protein
LDIPSGRDNQRVLTDERILGTGDFVDRILNEADERLKYQMAGNIVVEGVFLRLGLGTDSTSIGREFWNSTGGSSPPSGSFHVCYFQSP